MHCTAAKNRERCKVKLDCLYGGYEDPRNCAVCKCPDGLAGARCESIPLSTVLDASYICDSSCADNFLEIKHTSELQQTGFRQCCNAVPGSFISETNQIYIISSAGKSPAEFVGAILAVDCMLGVLQKKLSKNWKRKSSSNDGGKREEDVSGERK
uniref:EGF-like domain-containing protein n=1 Tax=Parascaris equorum TaxID=6256 RepID=A0A914S980_PAREQ